MKHDLEGDHIVSDVLLEFAEAERLGDGVVDPVHFADRVRMLAHVDVDAHLIGPLHHAGTGIGHEDGRRLGFAVTTVSTEPMPRIQRLDEPIRKVAMRALAGFEGGCDRIDHLDADERVALGGEVGARALGHPVALRLRSVLA